jgi:SPP1 gp7 family putative phage head morphogenesis protein
MQSLKQRVYLILEDKYGRMSHDIYYQIESAVMGATSPLQAQASIEEYLRAGGFNPTTSRTVLNTALAQAHNGGRMSVYAPLHDPFGVEPGSVQGYVYSAVMDDHTTDLCQSLNDEAFRCNDPMLPQPPLHHNCRSILIPVFAGEEPWGNSNEFHEFGETRDIISSHGGIPSGFGGV